jgi:hypothetical protein
MMRAGGRRLAIIPKRKTLDHIVSDLHKLLRFHTSLPEKERRSAELRRVRKCARAMLAVVDNSAGGVVQR